MKRFALVALLPAAALVGCNGGNLSNKPQGGPITEANSSQVAAELSATISGARVGAGSGTQKIHSNAANQSFAEGSDTGECFTVGGDVSDGDSDGIPVDATYTMDNCAYSDGTYNETYGGTEELKDSHPDVADSDYADNFDLTIAWTGPDIVENDHLAGSESGSSGADSYTYVENFTDDYSGTYQGADFVGSYAEDLTYVYGADSTMTVNGTWSEAFNGDSVGVTLETTDPLQLSCGCASGILSGTVVASSGDSSETMTWANCEETDTFSGPAS